VLVETGARGGVRPYARPDQGSGTCQGHCLNGGFPFLESPLQECKRPAWEYTGRNYDTRLVASDLDSKVLERILVLKTGLKITVELVQLPEGVECYCEMLEALREALRKMSVLDDIGIPKLQVVGSGSGKGDQVGLAPIPMTQRLPHPAMGAVGVRCGEGSGNDRRRLIFTEHQRLGPTAFSPLF
jgi:hypothetical protein